MQITYIGHSGISLRTPTAAMVWDYYIGQEPVEILRDAPRALAFVSHSHSDHFVPRIFGWRDAVPGLGYILSADVSAPGVPAVSMVPGDVWEGDGFRVRAFGSTDEGCSFLVETDGFRIFHAGDLNLWHWPLESTREEIDGAYADFDAALAPLAGESIDVAFFPVDPRMGADYDAGARIFLERIAPRYFVPIHFGPDFGTAAAFARDAASARTCILAPGRQGDTFELPDTFR